MQIHQLVLIYEAHAFTVNRDVRHNLASERFSTVLQQSEVVLSGMSKMTRIGSHGHHPLADRAPPNAVFVILELLDVSSTVP